MELKQYQIVLVQLDPTVGPTIDPTIGREMKKTRPCVIISPDEMNKYLQTLVIAPMTSRSRPYPTRVPVKHNETPGWVVLDQIRTIDRQRVIKILGQLTDKEMNQVKSTIHETYVA
jgi:mRNA interferase MazF